MFLFYSLLLVACQYTSLVTAHNYIRCTNAFPNLDELLTDHPRYEIPDREGYCLGFPRAFPANGTNEMEQYNEQKWPWQGIWSMLDNGVLPTHRVANWLQERPVYEETHKPAEVRPGSTVLLQVQTNNHAHEYTERPSGHYKIFLAGPAGTHLKTMNQLTFDRCIFSAPANKYAHILGDPTKEDGGLDDPQYSWLPLKLVDATGAWLPEGTYNFVFAYFWATGTKPQKDYMIPSYSSSFDITITPSANNTGAVSDCVRNDKACAQTLVGSSTSPGAKDPTDPWPPFTNNYLFTNYDGDDPATANGKRTFQPHFTTFVPASDMGEITFETVPQVDSWGRERLTAAIPLEGGEGATMPETLEEYKFMDAGGGEGIDVTQTLEPMGVPGARQGEGVEPIEWRVKVTGGEAEKQEGEGEGKRKRNVGRYMRGIANLLS